MFIMPGSMITQATVPASSPRRASSASASLNGTGIVIATVAAGMPPP